MFELVDFFDPISSTVTYLLADLSTKDAIVIDPVLDFDAAKITVSSNSVDRIITYADGLNLQIQAILETHVHADHLSGAWLLSERIPTAKVGISERFKEVYPQLAPLLGFSPSYDVEKSFDIFLKDHQDYNFGSINLKVLATPGHTPACTSFLVDNYLFVGDTIFMPDSGTGRCDFPGGSASQLFSSIKNILYSLPEDTWICTGHDYQPNGRAYTYKASVDQQKRENIHLNEQTTKDNFVSFREGRDQSLPLPKLIFQSLQVNLHGGRLPNKNALGQRLIQVPLNIEEDIIA